MSAFGYGDPKAAMSPSAMMGVPYQSQPAQQPMSGDWLQGVNFTPDVTTPWGDPGRHIAGSREISGSGNVFTSLGLGRQPRENVYAQNPWANPLETAFGGANSLYGPLKSTALGVAPSSIGKEQGTGAPLSGPKAETLAPVVGPRVDPKTFDQLYSQIKDLSPAQLTALDYAGKYRQNFATAAQDFSNAYANPNFAAQMGGSQQNVQNWLQSAYSQLMHRLNEQRLL